jgi:hypothetical protein
MQFGVYVHNSGSTWLNQIAGSIAATASNELSDVRLSEVDGLFIGLNASAAVPTGIVASRRKVKRDYQLKLITGGTEHYRCLIERDFKVSDAELLAAADSERTLFVFVQQLLCRTVDMALQGFPETEIQRIKSAILVAELKDAPQW